MRKQNLADKSKNRNYFLDFDVNYVIKKAGEPAFQRM